MPSTPGFPSYPSCITTCSSAYVCGKRYVFTYVPLDGLSVFRSQPGHLGISSQAPFHGRPTYFYARLSRTRILTSSARCGRASLIRGTRLPHLLHRQLAIVDADPAGDWMLFSRCMCLQLADCLLRFAFKTQQAVHLRRTHGPDFHQAVAHLASLSTIGISDCGQIGKNKTRNINTSGFARPNHTTTMRCLVR